MEVTITYAVIVGRVIGVVAFSISADYRSIRSTLPLFSLFSFLSLVFFTYFIFVTIDNRVGASSRCYLIEARRVRHTMQIQQW